MRLRQSFLQSLTCREKGKGWAGLGAGIVDKVSADLRIAFPPGFSRAYLMSMRAFTEAWFAAAIIQQPVGQWPWGHNFLLFAKLKHTDARLVTQRPPSSTGGHARCWCTTSRRDRRAS